MSEEEYAFSGSDNPMSSPESEDGCNTEKSTQASVFAMLLSQRPSSRHTADPLLARRPGLLSAPSDSQIHSQALSILRKERRTKLASIRHRPDLLKDLNRERPLKKAAIKGVVQLFNAVRKAQVVKDENNARQTTKIRQKKTEKPCSDISARNAEPSFMDLLKSGPSRII